MNIIYKQIFKVNLNRIKPECSRKAHSPSFSNFTITGQTPPYLKSYCFYVGLNSDVANNSTLNIQQCSHTIIYNGSFNIYTFNGEVTTSIISGTPSTLYLYVYDNASASSGLNTVSTKFGSDSPLTATITYEYVNPSNITVLPFSS